MDITVLPRAINTQAPYSNTPPIAVILVASVHDSSFFAFYG